MSRKTTGLIIDTFFVASLAGCFWMRQLPNESILGCLCFLMCLFFFLLAIDCITHRFFGHLGLIAEGFVGLGLGIFILAMIFTAFQVSF